MVDRLEELLALMRDEDEEDEREDALAVRLGAAVPAPAVSGIKTGDGPEDDEKEPDPERIEDEADSIETQKLNWLLDGKATPMDGQSEVPGADGAAENDAVENGAAEFLWDELTVPVMGQSGSVLLRRPGAGDVELAEPAGRSGQADTAEMDGVTDTLRSAERGLERLYQRAVQAGRPAAQALPAEQAGRTARAEEPGRTAALTVDELDRAVRRDSRRYDGGMTIF